MKISSLRLPALAVVGTILACATAVAAAPEKVSYKSGGDTVSAQLFLPEGKGPFPAIVVVHEWWGVTAWVLDQAKDFSSHGYAALVIDLYRGRSTKDPNEAHELMRGLPEDRAIRDLKAAVDYLTSRKDIRADRIGVTGWCMGGGYALKLALTDPRIRAVAMNYGPVATDSAVIKAMPAAVLGNFGGQDRGISADSVRAFEKELKADGKTVDIKIYDDAGHAFENPDNKDSYRPADTADAKRRVLEFFHAQLAG